MPFYLQMSKNITQQRDIYDTVIFRFLQIFYGLKEYVILILVKFVLNVCIIKNDAVTRFPTHMYICMHACMYVSMYLYYFLLFRK